MQNTSLFLAICLFFFGSCKSNENDSSRLRESFVRSDGYYSERSNFKLKSVAFFRNGLSQEIIKSSESALKRSSEYAEGKYKKAIEEQLKKIDSDFSLNQSQCRHIYDTGDEPVMASGKELINAPSPDFPQPKEEINYFKNYAKLVIDFIPGDCPKNQASISFPELQLPLFQLTETEKTKFEKYTAAAKTIYAIKPPAQKGQGHQPLAPTIGLISAANNKFEIVELCTNDFQLLCTGIYDLKGRLRDVGLFQANL